MTLTPEEFNRVNALSDMELEQYLRDGTDREQLGEYFGGEEEYESLRDLVTAPPHFAGRGAEVILLPGIMGSELADWTGAKIWLDKLALAVSGRLVDILLDSTGLNDAVSGHQITPVGLYKGAYKQIKKFLESKGHTVHTFPYDWRKPIDTSAHKLKDFVEERGKTDSSRQFVFIAHSMGGLVARRYLDLFESEAEKWLDKLIMLGTPNKGSYEPLRAMKGATNVAKIAGVRYGQPAVRRIIQSFPGLYEMSPNSEIFGQPEIYEAEYWMEETISAQHLEAAQQFHRQIRAHLPEKMFLIANRSLLTITRVDWEPQQQRFKFMGARVGDGTVPFDSAYLPDVPTYETKAEHGSIQKNEAVLRAIDDLINEGRTTRLDHYVPRMAAPEELQEIDPDSDEVLLKL